MVTIARPDTNELAGVPPLSADWYRHVVAFARSMPEWLGDAVGAATHGLPGVFAVFLLVAVWRAARHNDTGAMTLVLASPVAMTVAYLVSESLKTIVKQERPCRAVPGIARTLLECPQYGDWSFPSNHSTFAAAAAVALAVAWRPCVLVAAFVALLEGFSRILVGAHYPHDVVAGLVLGSTASALVMKVALRAVVPWVESLVSRRREPDDGDAATSTPRG